MSDEVRKTRLLHPSVVDYRFVILKSVVFNLIIKGVLHFYDLVMYYLYTKKIAHESYEQSINVFSLRLRESFFYLAKGEVIIKFIRKIQLKGVTFIAEVTTMSQIIDKH